MTDWIDFFVYAAFLFALWFVQPVAQRRLAIPFLVDRNPQWVAAHPEAVQAMAHARWRIWLSWALGAASLAVLASYQLGLWQGPPPQPGAPPTMGWMILFTLTMASMLAALVIGGAIGLHAHIRTRRRVPIAPHRRATLERRALDDYVPRPVQYLTYALVLANIGAWAAAALLEAHSSPLFWSRVATMLFLSAFFWFTARIAVMRRANVMDRVFGADFRRWEVRYTFSMQALTPIVGALRLYEEVHDVALLDMSRAIQLFMALFITYGLLRMARLPLNPDAQSPAAIATPLPAAPA